jgi:hypothetical protein
MCKLSTVTKVELKSSGNNKNIARDTNDRRHPVAVCRVGRETLVSGGVSRARVRRAVIAPTWGVLGRGLKARNETTRDTN